MIKDIPLEKVVDYEIKRQEQGITKEGRAFCERTEAGRMKARCCRILLGWKDLDRNAVQHGAFIEKKRARY